MRLIELKKLIGDTVSLVKDYASTTIQSSYAITNIQPIKRALLLLIKSGILNLNNDIEIQRIISSEGKNMLFDDSSQRDKIFRRIRDIDNAIGILNQWLDNIIPKEREESEDTISVMLPPMNNLDDLQKYTTSVQKGFSLIVNELDGGLIKFKTLDRGTDWITFAVGTVAVVKTLGYIWDLIIKIINSVKAVHEIKSMKSKVSQEKYKEDFYKQLVDFQKDAQKIKIEEGVKRIINEHDIKLKGSDPQSIDRIINGINELIDIAVDGAKIVPALNAAKEIEDIFPDRIELGYKEKKYLISYSQTSEDEDLKNSRE
jgi:hypothetical protein